jgi:hypothetical protein
LRSLGTRISILHICPLRLDAGVSEVGRGYGGVPFQKMLMRQPFAVAEMPDLNGIHDPARHELPLHHVTINEAGGLGPVRLDAADEVCCSALDAQYQVTQLAFELRSKPRGSAAAAHPANITACTTACTRRRLYVRL